jgi:NTE family protein
LGEPECTTDIELFPMHSKLPVNLIEVQDRMMQLLFSSKLILDEQLFQKMDDYVELIQQIVHALPLEGTIRQLPGYQELKRHRKIDSFHVFTMNTSELHSGASDFSKAAIERRIASGYQDALTQLEEFSRKSK